MGEGPGAETPERSITVCPSSPLPGARTLAGVRVDELMESPAKVRPREGRALPSTRSAIDRMARPGAGSASEELTLVPIARGITHQPRTHASMPIAGRSTRVARLLLT